MQNSRQAYVNLALATAAFAVAFAAWSLISPLSRQIQADLNLDNTSIGLLIALPTLLGALIRVPMGILTDRFGGRKVFTGLLLFTLLPIAFLGFAHSFWSYVIGAFFLGTAGASFAVGIPFVSRWFSADRQGTALGIYGVGNIGTAAAVLSMGPLMQLFGSRQDAFWFYLIPVAIMAVLFWLFARDAPATVQAQRLGASFAAVSRGPIAWQLSLFYFVTFGGFVFFANYLPQLLGDWFPLDRENAGLQAAIFTMAATFARPVGGWLADRFGGAKVLTWVFAFIVITRLVLAWQAGHANIVIVTDLLFAVAIGFGFGNGAVFKLVAQYFPKNTGLVSGIVGCAGGLGGFFPPLVMGFVRDHTGSYALGFVILAMLAAFCWVLLLARRSQRSDSRQAYVNLGLATAAFAVTFAAWSMISPLSHQIQADLNLDNPSIGLLIALPTLLGALMRVPMGVLTDRFGGRKVFTGLLLFTLLPIAFLGFAHSFWSYVVGAFFLGIAGASFAVGIPFVSRWFRADRQGTALGIYGVGNIGTAVAVFSMSPLVEHFGSRQDAFWFYLIPVAIMAVLFWLFARDAPATVQAQPLGASFATLAREPLAWQLGLFYFVTFGGFVFFANYLPQLLGDWFPLDRENAGLQVAIFTMAATFARPVGGWLADHFGGVKVLMWVFAFLVITRLVLAWQASHANIVIVTDLLFAVALGFGFGNGAIFKLVPQYFPNNTGLIGGVVGCAGGLGGFFPPLVMTIALGYVGSYALGFVILAMLAALCWALLLARSQPSDLRQAYVQRNQS